MKKKELMRVSPKRDFAQVHCDTSTSALAYASVLGTPFNQGPQQDYVPCRGSASSFQDQPNVPNYPISDRPPRFVCLMPDCSTTCSRANDLDRHYKAQHQSPGLKPEFKCQVEGCNRKEIPFNRKNKLREHMRNIHNIRV